MNAAFTANYSQSNHDYLLIESAISYLERNVRKQPELAEVAHAVGLSEFHFQRLFTRWAGISPKRFLQFLTKESAREMVHRSQSLLEATYQMGLSSSGRLHDLFVTTEAVTPGEYKSRGVGLTIKYAFHPTPFGNCLIGMTDKGICHLGFVQTSEKQAVDELISHWNRAEFVADRVITAPLIRAIFDLSKRPEKPMNILLKGTNFQIKVWEALLRIAPGNVTTYEEIATQIGNPNAVRAVGNAVGRNPIPVLIPCHRVIRKLGDFGQYRYGATRKKALLGWELARTGSQASTV